MMSARVMSAIGAMAARMMATAAAMAACVMSGAAAPCMMAASAATVTLFGDGVGRVQAYRGGDAGRKHEGGKKNRNQ
jgi:hypothetical protein